MGGGRELTRVELCLEKEGLFNKEGVVSIAWIRQEAGDRQKRRLSPALQCVGL